MRALHQEALTSDKPEYVYLRCAGVLAVHQPVASSHSALVRTAIETRIGSSSTPLTLDLALASLDHDALRLVVSWMYECRDDPPSIQTTIEMTRIASYMQMSELETDCSGFIEKWIHSLCDPDPDSDSDSDVAEDVRQCAKVWIMLATTLIAGPIECVRSTLVERIMHLRVDDPTVVELLGASSLDTLARLTCPVLGETASCLAFAIDLALMWHQIHGLDGVDVDVLGHIPIEALPSGFVDKLLASGRLGRDDERRVRQRLKLLSRVSVTLGSLVDVTFGWVGLFDCRIGAVKLVVQREGPRVHVRPLNFGTRKAVLHSHDHVVHTSQASVVDGRVYMFGVHTGYVYSEFDSVWHPFGVVPRRMAEAPFATAVYDTWVVFVSMTGTVDPCALDVTTCAWKMLPPMCVRRRWPCIAIMQGSLYVIGGTTGNGGDAPTERLCLSCLTQTSSGWENLGLRIGRYRSAAVVVGDRILVLGGYYFPITRPGIPRVSSCVTSIRVTGTQCSIGVMANDMTCARAGHGAFVCGNHVVVLGGSLLCRRMASPCADDVAAEIFDVASGLWTHLDVDREPPDPAAWLTDSGYEPPV